MEGSERLEDLAAQLTVDEDILLVSTSKGAAIVMEEGIQEFKGILPFGWTLDGKILGTRLKKRGDRYELVEVDFDGNASILYTSRRAIEFAAPYRDRNHMIVIDSDVRRRSRILEVVLDSGDVRQLWDDTVKDLGCVHVHPDGRIAIAIEDAILYGDDKEIKEFPLESSVYCMSGPPEHGIVQIIGDHHVITFPQMTKDDDDNVVHRLIRLDTRTGKPRTILICDSYDTQFTLSPDQHYLAMVADRFGALESTVFAFPSMKKIKRIHPDPDMNAVWMNDSKKLSMVVEGSIYSIDIPGDEPPIEYALPDNTRSLVGWRSPVGEVQNHGVNKPHNTRKVTKGDRINAFYIPAGDSSS